VRPTFHVCERSLLVEDKHMSKVGIGSAVTFKFVWAAALFKMACRLGAVDPVSAMSPLHRCDCGSLKEYHVCPY
jgi:hypothetical protein